MKQHITPEQLQKLSLKAKERYDEWYRDHNSPFAANNVHIYEDDNGVREYDLPPLSIGQMIEFLDEHEECLDIRGSRMHNSYLTGVPDNTIVWSIWGNWSSVEDEPNLCDALWEAVEGVLEKAE